MEVLELGHRLLVVAACLTGVVFVLSLGGVLRRDRRLVEGARAGLYLLAAATVASAGCLVHGFVTGQYDNEYIYNYSERGLPTFFKIAGLWGGLDGSLLFWLAVLTLYAAAVAFQHRWSSRSPSGRRMEPWVYVALASVIGFFVAISLQQNVFKMMDLDQRTALAMRHGVGIDEHGHLLDGHGLNPQLVNYWFVIHPPSLYLGFIGLAIPFAFTVAALAVGEVGDYWVRIVRRWTMVAWLFLTCGIILGGLWAYRQLGWGGYWAWDPVENASFLPWLTATAFLHSIMIQERRDMLKAWNVFLIFMTFFLTIVGTWMTRSGVVQSVHAFSEGSVGPWFQVFLFSIAALGGFMVCWRHRSLRGSKEIESLLSREVAFYVNNLVLLVIALIVFFLSFLPKLSHDWLAKPMANQGWFEIATTPFFALLLFLTAVGPGLGWVKTSGRSLRRNFLGTTLVSLAAVTLVYVFFYYQGMLGTWREVLLPRFFHIEGLEITSWTDIRENLRDLLLWQHSTALYPTGLFLWLAFFICATVGSELLRAVRSRVRLRGNNVVEAVALTIVRNNRRWGGYTVHIGIATLTVGIIASSMFQQKLATGMSPGDTVSLGPYRITLADVDLRDHPIDGEPYWKDELTFRVTRLELPSDRIAHGAGEDDLQGTPEVLVTELRPESRFYPKQEQWINEVSIHRRLLGDIYIFARRTSVEGQAASFGVEIFLNPLMLLIYVGWIVMILGGLFAVLPVPGSRVGLAE